jgi:phage FluMu protein Com
LCPKHAHTTHVKKSQALPPSPGCTVGGDAGQGRGNIQQADKLLCESWNERMWSHGEPIDPSPTIDQAVNGGFPWLEIRCARCKTPSDVDLAVMKHPRSTFVHDLASRLRCRKCAKAGRRPAATLLQLGWQSRHPRTET